MEETNEMTLQVGDMCITVTTQNGEIVSITAVDEYGVTYDVGFVFERLTGGRCQICRYIDGHKECWEIPCGVIEKPLADLGKECG
jgi:hypothetical protein